MTLCWLCTQIELSDDMQPGLNSNATEATAADFDELYFTVFKRDFLLINTKHSIKSI